MSAHLSPSDLKIAAITREAFAAIGRHASTAYPEECCGALLEKHGTIVEAFALPNTTDAGAARRFRVGPEDYRRAEDRAGTIGGALAGFYHSHPDEPARPSAYDLEHAWPNLLYVIISVEAGAPGDVTVWRLRDDRSTFEQGELRWHNEF